MCGEMKGREARWKRRGQVWETERQGFIISFFSLTGGLMAHHLTILISLLYFAHLQWEIALHGWVGTHLVAARWWRDGGKQKKRWGDEITGPLTKVRGSCVNFKRVAFAFYVVTGGRSLMVWEVKWDCKVINWWLIRWFMHSWCPA